MPLRRKRRSVNGIFLLDKPQGLTSNAALQQVKRLFNAEKAGHTGSLDPLATGLLPICFGEATKFSRFLLESDKRYQVKILLGVKTDTGDAEGTVIAEHPVNVTQAQMDCTLEKFRGKISQVPSMYSAIKHQGQPLYKLARQGIEVEREAREVMIYTLKQLDFVGNELSLDVHASKGTYVRSIADDIGEELGCGAHVIALRRLGAGPYLAEQMLTLDTLSEASSEEACDNYLLPIDSSLTHLENVILSDSTAFYLRQGQPVFIPKAPTNGWVKLTFQERFLGVGEVLEDGKIAPKRLVASA